jgi:protein PsiE
MSKLKKLPQITAKLLHIPMVIVLSAIGIFFAVLIVQMLIAILMHSTPWTENVDAIIEEVFMILLVIELIAAIKVYLTQNYHFPLRFFFYIGITDIVRHIIIERTNPEKVLTLTIALLMITIAFSILEIKSRYLRGKLFKSDDEAPEL